MKSRWLSLLLALVVTPGAFAAIITFDEAGMVPGYPAETTTRAYFAMPNTPIGTVVTNQYQSVGVLFSIIKGADYISSLAFVPCANCSLLQGQFLGVNTPISGTPPSLPNTNPPAVLTVTFDFPAVGSSISVVVGDTEHYKQVKTFDENGALIEEQDLGSPTDNTTVISVLQFTTGLVKMLEFTDTRGNGFVIDDLQFELVPEPGTWLVTTSGLAVLALLLRRRRR